MYLDGFFWVRAVPKSSSLPRNVKLLGWASFFNDVASEVIYPLMPQFLIGVLGGNRFLLGLIEGVAESTGSLLKLWSGSWSDRAGSRKPFVVGGYTVAALARPAIGIVAAPWQLFAARIVDRVGKGVRTSPRDALIADCTPHDARGRAFGYQRALDHLGAAVGPVLAAGFLWLWPGEFRLLFMLTIIPGLIVIALLTFGLRETGAEEKEKVEREPFRLSLRPFSGRFRVYLVSIGIFTLGNSSDAFLLVRAGELGVSTIWLPILWCLFHIIKSIGSRAIGGPIDRYGAAPIIFIGWGLYAGVYLGFGLAWQTWQAWALFCGYGVVQALTEPAEKTMVASLTPNEHRGLGYGWFNFVVGIAALPASLLFGLLYDRFGPLVPFGVGAGLALLAALVLSSIAGRRQLHR